ncbi:Hypothetical predicted protein, partial [Paramuricea clavata]
MDSDIGHVIKWMKSGNERRQWSQVSALSEVTKNCWAQWDMGIIGRSSDTTESSSRKVLWFDLRKEMCSLLVRHNSARQEWKTKGNIAAERDNMFKNHVHLSPGALGKLAKNVHGGGQRKFLKFGPLKWHLQHSESAFLHWSWDVIIQSRLQYLRQTMNMYCSAATTWNFSTSTCKSDPAFTEESGKNLSRQCYALTQHSINCIVFNEACSKFDGLF